MKTVGIIAEYNPFHNGHLYQLNKAKELSGADYVVVVMSGNFVQRGTPALLDKYGFKMYLAEGIKAKILKKFINHYIKPQLTVRLLIKNYLFLLKKLLKKQSHTIKVKVIIMAELV